MTISRNLSFLAEGVSSTGVLGASNGGSGATTLTGYLYGNGTSAFTASTTIPTTALSGTISNAQLANSSLTVNGTSISLGGSGTVTAAAGTLTGTTLNSTVVSSSLTSVGILTSGTWNASTIGAIYGGTGQNTVTTGDLLYGSASNTWSKLGIGSTGTILRVVGGIPSWGTDYTGTVTSVAASVPSFLSISGSPITTSGTLAITYSGTALPIANGGTALTSFTSNGVLYASNSSTLTTGSSLQFDGNSLGLNITPNNWKSGWKVLQNVSGAFYSNGGGNQIGVGQNWYYDNSSGNNLRVNTGYSSDYYQYGGTHVWSIASSGSAGSTISFTQAMTLDNSGNLLVGTIIPLNTGSGRTVFTMGASTDIFLNFGNASSTRWGGIYANSSKITTVSDGYYTIETAGSERVRVDSSGNLLVGTTSTSVTSGGIVLQPNGGGSGISAQVIGHITGSGSGQAYHYFNYNSSVVGSITQNGTTGVLYNLTSDYRLKDNPMALTGASEFIMALQPKTWDWHDGSGKGVGFIAHEFMEIAKYSGNGTKDEIDAEGNPVYQSIQPSSSEVMANLVALLQEQQAIIEQLKAKVGL